MIHRQSPRRQSPRRQFLLEAVATATLGVAQPLPSIAVVRVSNGKVIESGGDADTWVVPLGSTLKPFVLAQLIRSGRLKARETYLCNGVHRIAGRNFTCSHPTGLPPLDPARIIAYSCNGGVAHFAERFAPGELASALRAAGFRVGAADTRIQALGEEGVWATPVELAQAYRRLALQQDSVIIEGLAGAVQYGTAQAAAVDGISIAGKTGSAIASNGLHAALFAGFAPSRRPEFVTVVVTQGRSGGSDAAPLAGQTFRRCLLSTWLAGTGEYYRVRVRDRIVGIGTEEYVTGVLAGESSVFQQAAALKAMAIAARTFAAHQRGRHAREGFDFCDTTHCQRFDWSGNNTRLRAVAESTAGQTIRFEGRLAFTPYTMSCGGMSEAADAVWREAREPYLNIRRDPFCAVRTWGCHLTPPEVERALRDAGLKWPTGLRSIMVAERSASGRATRLVLIGDTRLQIDAGAFRFAVGRALGWNLIRSNWFEISGIFDFEGKGEGHGVGLCQRGAEAMAAGGHSYREILSFYFPGTTTIEWRRMGAESVDVYGTDPNRDEAVLHEAERLLKTLPWPLRSSAVIYVYPDVDTFRSETGEPGWVAARTRGSRIDLQPNSVLLQHGARLQDTLHHELLHVAVEQGGVDDLPVWFREGLVEYLSGARGHQKTAPSELDLLQRSDRARASVAHAEAASQVLALVDRYGEATVLGWVSAGLPATVTNSISNTPNTNNK